MAWLKEHWFKGGIVISLLIASSGVGYYFGVSLPRQQDQKMAFEKEKYIDELRKLEEEKTADEQAALTRGMTLADCLKAADADYLKFLRLNGSINANGSISAPSYITETADKQREAAKDECFREDSASK